jgi:hypothetical protein
MKAEQHIMRKNFDHIIALGVTKNQDIKKEIP